MKRLSRFPKEKFLVRSGEPSIEPPKAPIVPQKRHANLAEFLEVNGNICGLAYRNRAWFENANYLFHPDYGEEGSNLTFAQSKDMFYVHPQGSVDYFFDLEDARFDSRFIFPDLLHGSLHFGNYHDNQLGRIFFLTEPKDASDVLLSVNEPSGICEWLKDDPNVKFFRHEDKHFQLYAVLPIGSRLDLNHELVISHPTSADEDRALFAQLFQEKLHHAVDFNASETHYVRPLTAAEEESKAHRVDYADRLDTLSEKFREICRIRHIVTASPFDDPISVYYKGHSYFYNHDNIVQLEAIIRNDHEFYQNLEKRIDFVESLIKNGLADICAEFNVNVALRLDRVIRLANLGEEVVMLSVYPADNSLQSGHIIHQHSVDLHDFNTPSEGGIAEAYVKDTEEFFDRYREKFHAFKKLYEVNLSYHNLVNLSSRPPELDYTYIFRDL
ncbi:hypothetical protein IKE86_02430 [Candidatus Saccharibacteria bacterium]|nr:hypothetical protein [Candidatus Saccharibacteria bacterium]